MSKQKFLTEVNLIKLDCYSNEEFLYIKDNETTIARVSLINLNAFNVQFKDNDISIALQTILIQLLHIFSNTPITER